jgi:hypothetical protein
VFVLDDIVLMWVIREYVVGAGRSSVGISRERDERCGRAILLVIKTCLFLNRQWRKRSGGIRGAWKTRAQRGFEWRKDGRWGWGMDVVRGRAFAKGLCRRAFLTERAFGKEAVRAGDASGSRRQRAGMSKIGDGG